MRHSRKEIKRRALLFKAFVAHNPPRMPADFSHKEYKRVVSYARTAFYTGYNTGENEICKGHEYTNTGKVKK